MTKDSLYTKNTENTNEVSLAEALQMEIIINQALVDLLVAKGVISQDELMERIEELKRSLPSYPIH